MNSPRGLNGKGIGACDSGTSIRRTVLDKVQREAMSTMQLLEIPTANKSEH